VSLGYRVALRYMREPTFSRFCTVPACDRQTNRRTHGQTDTRYIPR